VSASASPSGAAASPSPSASADAANPCPTPTVEPPATPKSFDAAPAASLAGGKPWTLTLRTTCGAVTVALDGAEAPKAVSSTIFLSREKFWDGSPCHRLTTEGIFVLQCGDPTGTGTGGPGYTYGPVENAPKASGSGEGLYPAGTVAMARASSLTSQGSQFFLVYQDTTLPAGENGYTVIGRITKGLDVVRKVAAGGVDPAAGGGDGKPRRAVSIVSTSVTQG
jgi:peptidyl-prolyl cis-trans isomerase B (cyclophilin B)